MKSVLSFFILVQVVFAFVFASQQKEWSFLANEPKHVLSDHFQTPNDPIGTITNLMSRVFGPDNQDLLSQFDLQLISIKSPNNPRNNFNQSLLSYLDIIEYATNTTTNKIIIRGSSTVGLAQAFNLYLENICNTTYDWRTYTIELPINTTYRDLPRPSELFHKKRSVPLTYYENVCTVSYSQAFWDWKAWEEHLDWMAMQGINFPLAFTGQEYIWAKTFYEFNFTTTDLQSFFAGTFFFFCWLRFFWFLLVFLVFLCY